MTTSDAIHGLGEIIDDGTGMIQRLARLRDEAARLFIDPEDRDDFGDKARRAERAGERLLAELVLMLDDVERLAAEQAAPGT